MTSHRILRPFASAFQVDPGPGVAAGLMALFGAFWNLHAVVLFLFAGSASVFDLWTGARRGRVRRRLKLPGAFDRAVLDEGIVGKITILAFYAFVGIAIDSILMLASTPAGLPIGAFFQNATPTLAILLAVRFAREVTSALDNLEQTPGSEGELPELRKVIDWLRLRLTGSKAEPARRWDDDRGLEKRAKIRQLLDESPGPSRPNPNDPSIH